MFDLLSYQDLFDYFKKEREKLLPVLKNMSEEEFTKNRGLSFDSIKNVFVHTVIVEDNWLHYRIAGLGEITKRVEDFRNMQEIIEYMKEVDTKTNKFFTTITQDDFKKLVKRTKSDGEEIMYPLGDVLYHIPIEMIHHYGEIFAELWKINNYAPYYSYLEYAANTSSM